jgi:hypothetical protein
MHSIISAAALRSVSGLLKALLSPSCRVICEEQVEDWVKDRKSLEVLSYEDGSGFEVAYRGRLWIISAGARQTEQEAF